MIVITADLLKTVSTHSPQYFHNILFGLLHRHAGSYMATHAIPLHVKLHNTCSLTLV